MAQLSNAMDTVIELFTAATYGYFKAYEFQRGEKIPIQTPTETDYADEN